LFVILLTMGCLGQQYIVDVGRVGVAFNRCPGLILHENHKNGPNGGTPLAPAGMVSKTAHTTCFKTSFNIPGY